MRVIHPDRDRVVTFECPECGTTFVVLDPDDIKTEVTPTGMLIMSVYCPHCLNEVIDIAKP